MSGWVSRQALPCNWPRVCASHRARLRSSNSRKHKPYSFHSRSTGESDSKAICKSVTSRAWKGERRRIAPGKFRTKAAGTALRTIAGTVEWGNNQTRQAGCKTIEFALAQSCLASGDSIEHGNRAEKKLRLATAHLERSGGFCRRYRRPIAHGAAFLCGDCGGHGAMAAAIVLVPGGARIHSAFANHRKN